MQNKLDYLTELESELKFLKKKDRHDIMKYYQQKIDTELDYGTPEEKILINLPSPREVAIKVYKDKGINYLQLQKGKIKVTTIIFTLLSALLIIGTIYLGVSLLFILVKMIVNMGTLYFSFFKLPLVDLFLSTLFLTIYIILVIIFIVILIELMLLIVRTIIHRLLDIYPNIKEINLEPYSILYWINKFWKNEQYIYKVFGVLVILLIGVGVIGYFSKSYIYRVLTNTTQNEVIYQLEDLDLTNVSISVTNYETGLVIIPTDENHLSIRYRYEIDHQLSWEVNNNTLFINTKDPKRFDLLNLLKEPLQYIYIMVPSSISLDKIDLKITYGELKLEKIELLELNILMLNGQIGLKDLIIDDVNINVNKISLRSEDSLIDKLTLTMQLGTYVLIDNDITNLIMENTFADGEIKNLNAETITINNRSGNFDFKQLNAKTLALNTSSGDVYLENYTLEEFTYEGTDIGNLHLSKGIHNKATIEMPNGLINISETSGDTFITGYDLYLTSINQQSGKLDIKQVLGTIDIFNDLETANLISFFKCEASDVDLAIKNAYIEEMELNLGKAIVVIEDVYGKVVNITVNSGDLNYHNSNLEYVFDFFKATINLGGKNVNIANTEE